MRYTIGFLAILFTFASCVEREVENNIGTSDTTDEVVEAGSVTVYSHRHYDIDKEIFKAFEEETGIEVLVKKDKASKLIELISQKGDDADVLITVDVANLEKARAQNIFEPITNTEILDRVPANLRDADNNWVSLTKRYRILAYSKERVNPEELTSYEALADSKWKGKIAVRSSDNSYNQSLMASIIASSNQEEATKWAQGVVANFARDPKGNDRDQVKEVAAGRADVAIVNTYYIGKLLNSDNEAEVEAGNSVGLIFPNQEGRGAHANVSGIGICKGSKNKENAEKLIAYLLSDAVQEMYSSGNYEYPVVENVQTCELLSSWGDFKEDEVNLGELGKLNESALDAFAAAGWK